MGQSLVSTVVRPLPVYPEQRTSSDGPVSSGSCHERTWSPPNHLIKVINWAAEFSRIAILN
jgi:hypothetical protein